MLRTRRATSAAIVVLLAALAGSGQAVAQTSGSLATAAQLTGEGANDFAGTSVAGAGDVNGDGFDDLLVGAPNKGGADTGAAYVVLGGPAGWGSEAPLSRPSVIEYTGAAAEQVGSSVAAAGDVNGDGFDDVLIGAPLNDTAGNDAGAAYLVLGSATPVSSVLSIHPRYTGEVAGDRAGTSVAGAGDVNGDGRDDVVIGAPLNTAGGAGAGAAYVVLGTFPPVSGSLGSHIRYAGNATDAAGTSVAGGDFDGDGLSDVIVGAPGNDNAFADAGAVFIEPGSTTPASGALDGVPPNVRLTGGGDAAGSSVGMGDVTGDGRADAIIGAPTNAVAGTDAGAVYVVAGRSGMPSNSIPVVGTRLTGEGAGDRAGTSVAMIGDVNRDNIAEFAVGAPLQSGVDRGAAYLVPGNAGAGSLGAHVRYDGVQNNDKAGTSVGGAGDVNGDALPDLIVGAPESDGLFSNGGSAYVVFAPPPTPAAPSYTTRATLRGNVGNAFPARFRQARAIVDFTAGALEHGSIDVTRALFDPCDTSTRLARPVWDVASNKLDPAGGSSLLLTFEYTSAEVTAAEEATVQVLTRPSSNPCGDWTPVSELNLIRDPAHNRVFVGLSGATAIGSFTLAPADDPAPTIQVTGGPSTGSSISSSVVGFTFTSNEGSATFRCRVDEAAFDVCSSPHATAVLSEGSHTFRVKAVDAAGNSSEIAERTFTVDTGAGAAIINSGPANGSTSSDPTPSMGFAASEPGSKLACRVDGGSFQTCTSPLTIGPLSDGVHTFTVFASDSAGNQSTQVQRTWTVDSTPPPVSITSGLANGAHTADSTPQFGFSSTEGGATFRCRVDESVFTACSSPHTTVALSDGSHTFQVKAVDLAGNASDVSQRTFTVDTQAPVATINSGPADGSTSSDRTPSFGFAANEPGAQLDCKLDGGSFEDCTSPLTLGPLADGAHTFTVRATDAAGQSDQVQRDWTVDGAAPTVNIAAGTANGAHTADATPQFAFSSGDPGATFRCQVDDATFTPCTSPHTTIALGEGEHTFAVRAVDVTGNASDPLTRRFTVDTQAPVVAIDSGPGEGTTTRDRDPQFGFAANEQGAALECRIDGSAFQPCTSPRASDQLPDGTHTFAVRAIDRAGNASAPVERSWTIDATGPRVEIASGPAFGSLTRDANPTFAFRSSEGGSRFLCRYDSEAFRPCSGPDSDRPGGALADGTHTFFVRPVDGAQNAGDPLDVAFTVDTQAPGVTITGPRSVRTRSRAQVTFKVAATDRNLGGVTCQVRRSGKPVDCARGSFKTAKLRPGSYTVVATATDQAGNQKVAQKAFKVVRRR